jgi:hypothetical protein
MMTFLNISASIAAIKQLFQYLAIVRQLKGNESRKYSGGE